MTHAQTVTGLVPATRLGQTLMHEHILCDLRDPLTRDSDTTRPDIGLKTRFEVDYYSNRHQPNMRLDDDDVAAGELTEFRAAGGQTMVELTIGGIRPQPERLAALSTRSGVNIVMGTGYYIEPYLSAAERALDVEALTAVLRTSLDHGAWGTNVRAGLIGELGCNAPLAAVERRQLVAAARVQRETGVAITIHPGRHCDSPAQIADILVAHGALPDRTVIGHMDRTIFDIDRLKTLLSRGFILEWDFFGIETSQYWMPESAIDLPTDYMRLDLMLSLAAMGHAHQLLMSHDICTQTRLMAFGGHGYGHIGRHIVPMMRRRGLIETVLVTTPARLLAYRTVATSQAAP